MNEINGLLDAQGSWVYASGEADDSRISGKGGETAKVTEWAGGLDKLVEGIKTNQAEKIIRGWGIAERREEN